MNLVDLGCALKIRSLAPQCHERMVFMPLAHWHCRFKFRSRPGCLSLSLCVILWR